MDLFDFFSFRAYLEEYHNSRLLGRGDTEKKKKKILDGGYI